MNTWDPEALKQKVRKIINNMTNFEDEFIYDEHGELTDVQTGIAFSWEGSKGEEHLKKRIKHGHLPPGINMDYYNSIIDQLLNNSYAAVSVHKNSFNKFVVGMREFVNGKDWIVIFNDEGVIESAYPPNNFDTYFSSPYFQLGLIDDLPSD